MTDASLPVNRVEDLLAQNNALAAQNNELLQRLVDATVTKGCPMLLTAGEAAAYLGIGRTKLFAITARGDLPAVAVPGHADRHFRRKDLDAFIEKLRVSKRASKRGGHRPRHAASADVSRN